MNALHVPTCNAQIILTFQKKLKSYLFGLPFRALAPYSSVRHLVDLFALAWIRPITYARARDLCATQLGLLTEDVSVI